jgi:putative nucleotidyltransferase with HDIG domain
VLDIPLAGDASRLWTTDDASAVLPDLAIASDSSASESGGNALMHGKLLRLGTNGNAKDIPLMSETSRESGTFSWPMLPSLTRERLLELWVLALTLAAGGLCGGLVIVGFRIHQPAAVAVLAALAFAADYGSIRLRPNLEVTIASLVCVFAAVVLGPLSGAVVAAVGLLRDLPRRDTAQPILRWANWTSKRVVATVSAGLIASAIIASAGDGFLGLFAAVTGAFVVETIVGETLSLVAPAIRQTISVRATVHDLLPSDLVSVPLHVPAVAVLAYVYETISPWSVALFALPALAAQRLLLLYRQQRDTSDALGLANERLASANLSFATALVATLDARDRYTAGHSTAVAIYARDIAKRMGLSEREQDLVHLCGLVHDVGKIGLPAGLLEKPGALTLDERREMERHSEIGEDILRNVDDYGEIAEVVRSHHERVDGTGYPDRLNGDEIPLLARIIAVADAYNAMTSDRPYRDAMPSRVARLRLAQAVESQFDTGVVAAFEAILATASEAYRLGLDDAFGLATVAASAGHDELPPAMAFPVLAEAAS